MIEIEKISLKKLWQTWNAFRPIWVKRNYLNLYIPLNFK